MQLLSSPRPSSDKRSRVVLLLCRPSKDPYNQRADEKELAEADHSLEVFLCSICLHEPHPVNELTVHGVGTTLQYIRFAGLEESVVCALVQAALEEVEDQDKHRNVQGEMDRKPVCDQLFDTLLIDYR